MIEACALVKHYDATAVVNDLNFPIRAGLVTGFLGPTATMRLILGLDYPSAGSVTVDGRSYAQLSAPMHKVGALLDAGAVHGGRSARNQLLGLAQTNGIGGRRVDEVLEMIGLAEVARKRSPDCAPLRPALATCSHGTAVEGCLLSADQPPEHQSADDLENAHDDEPDAE